MADAVREIRDQITREALLEAIQQIDQGESNNFGPSFMYDVIHEEKEYAPKEVVGLAVKNQLGRTLGPNDFEGGIGTPCFSVLLSNGFILRQKLHKDLVDQEPLHPNSWRVKEAILQYLERGPANRKTIRMHIQDTVRFSEGYREFSGKTTKPHWRVGFGHAISALEKCGYTSKQEFGGDYTITEFGLSELHRKASNDEKKKTMDVRYKSYLDSRKTSDPKPPVVPEKETFDSTPLEATTFLSTKEAASICELLQRKKNIILQGAPGTGKTYIARALAEAITGDLFVDNYHIVQFHQTYAYEDFVEGYRPDGDGGFELRSGVFKRICEEARKHHDPVILVLDEINRGNLSKIFGELLVLLEADKRGPNHGVTLSYSGDLQDRFSIPENLYVIGTMNTADRSLALVDYALRRRFGFFHAKPKFASPKFKAHLQKQSFPEEVVDQIVSVMTSLNDAIASSKTLGPGFCIGHSFFCPSGPVDRPEEWYQDILENEIEPLIDEYCGLSGKLKDKLIGILRSDVD